MSDPQPIEPSAKVPWPGEPSIARAAAFTAGLSHDKSGVEEINYWATTASQEEIDDMLRRAHAYGSFVGFAAGYFGVTAIFRWLFGNHDG